MPPSKCLASSSRSSHSAAIFRNPLTADGLSRFTTSLLERSVGWSHLIPVRGRLSVAIFCSYILQLWSIIHTIMDRCKPSWRSQVAVQSPFCSTSTQFPKPKQSRRQSRLEKKTCLRNGFEKPNFGPWNFQVAAEKAMQSRTWLEG